ncbi:MAG: SMP-30/gluconolactonase/LRE family protein [Ignavibacteriales bacterium]|nr:SMP-30/gluconolactonase/LRE family protein [Ignavibacteriales bacterium]
MKSRSIIRLILSLALLTACVSALFGQSPIPPEAKLEKLASGLLQPEGPVWKDGAGLLFSDIKRNLINVWSPLDGSVKLYLQPSDSSNGMTFDQQGRLVLTQMRLRRVARQELNGTITPLASTYDGKKLNSPNDLVVRSDGSIFFTDPDFNIPSGQKRELNFKGIFRITPKGALVLLDSAFDKPNGICFSPDEKKLYVNESARCLIYVWDVIGDSLIVNKLLFYSIPATGYADGMKVDPSGNLYCAGPTGVWIISPTGQYLGKIAMTENPSNCAWGDNDRKTLYMTAGSSLYRIRTITTGLNEGNQYSLPGEIELRQNYPNPFNGSTDLSYSLPRTMGVELRVYNSVGHLVCSLVQETKEAGCHLAAFDASSMASGVYFASLVTRTERKGLSIQSKKMILIR